MAPVTLIGSPARARLRSLAPSLVALLLVAAFGAASAAAAPRAGVLSPTVCVERAANGLLRAQFGYVNRGAAVRVPRGSANRVSPASLNGRQPVRFAAGKHAAFRVTYRPGTRVAWRLAGRTAVATHHHLRSLHAAKCPLEVRLVGASTFNATDANTTVEPGEKDWESPASELPNNVLATEQASATADPSTFRGLVSGGGSVTDADADAYYGPGNVPPGANLQGFRVAWESIGADDYLYLGYHRQPSTGGTKTFSFELDQSSETVAGVPAGMQGIPVRTPGDLLIVFDYHGGGPTPAIDVHRWLGAGDAGTCEVAGPKPCWSEGRALANAHYDASAGPSFGEAAINLTGSGVFSADECTTFAQAYVKSRSSHQFTAELKDLLAPQQVAISRCNLSATKSVTQRTVEPGGALTYTIALSNTGTATAAGVRVVDPLPDGVVVTSLSEGCAAAGSPVTVTCVVDVPPGSDTRTITIEATAPSTDAVTKVCDQASITQIGDVVLPGPIPTNTVCTKIVRPRLIVDKSPAKQTVDAGGTVTWTASITNAGAAPARAVTFTDTVPAGFRVTAATWRRAGTDATAEAPCQVSDVAGEPRQVDCPASGGDLGVLGTRKANPENRIVVTITATAPSGLEPANPYCNFATAAAAGSGPATNEKGACVTVRPAPQADVGIAKSGAPATIEVGQSVTYTLVVTNHGPADATAVRVVDTLPAGLTPVSGTPGQGTCAAPQGPVVTCDLGPLAAGASTQVQVVATAQAAAAGTTVTDVATVSMPSGVIDTNPANDTAAATTAVAAAGGTAGGPTPTVDLAMAKSVDRERATTGVRITWTLRVTNGSAAAAAGVTVTDTLPANVDVQGVPDGCSRTGSVVICAIGTLAPGETRTIVIAGTATAVGDAVNTASVSTTDADTNPANNQATTSTPVRAAQAVLAIAKSAKPSLAKRGGLVAFTIRVRVSRAAAVDLRVCDRLPPHMSFQSAPGATFRKGQACWTRASVPAGTVLRFRVVARVAGNAPAGRLVNVAVAAAANAPDARATARVRIAPARGAVGGIVGVTG